MSTFLIGVVGGGEGSTNATAQAQAPLVGLEIVMRGHLLVTGGAAETGSRAVKDLAMDGGLMFPGAAGLIGLIPLGPAGGAPAPHPAKPGHQIFLFQTGMTNHQRDPLTGALPDALIVLAGGSGTCAECAYALAAGKPVVFLDAWDHLLGTLARKPGGLGRILGAVLPSAYSAGLASEMQSFLGGTLAGGTSASPGPHIQLPSSMIRIDGAPNGPRLAVQAVLRMLETRKPDVPRLAALVQKYRASEAAAQYTALAQLAPDFDRNIDRMIISINRV